MKKFVVFMALAFVLSACGDGKLFRNMMDDMVFTNTQED